MEHDASDMDSFVEELEEMLSEKLQMLQKKKSILGAEYEDMSLRSGPFFL